jgi:hypothetical protein
VTQPAPLVPADVDLRDFQGMWIDTDRLLRSDTWVLGTGDEKAAAMSLWLESWHQVPAASLPSHDRILAKLSQSERWAKSREHALRGWVACSDGRLYHPVVAEKALEAWIEKLAAAINGAEGNAKRWQVNVETGSMRDKLRAAADLLRNLNPQSRTFKKKAVLVILAGSPPESGPDSPPDVPPDSPPDSPPDTTKVSPPDRKGPDQTGPDQTGLFKDAPSELAGSPLRVDPPPPPPAFDGHNGETLNGKAVVAIADGFELPTDWGFDAEALGFKPPEVMREAERFRQYWTRGQGKGKRRSVKGWRQSWSNWLGKAAERQQR